MFSNYSTSVDPSVRIDYLDPSVPEIFRDRSAVLVVCHSVGIIFFLMTTIKFFFFVPTILRNTPKQFISRTLFMTGIYSILSASAYTSMVVPRAYLFCDAITLIVFGLAVYEFFCLCVDYAGGESNFIIKANDEKVLSLRTIPFCCVCYFLKPMKIDKRKFTILRLMQLQLPISFMVIYFLVLVIQMEDTALYHKLSTWILPLIGVGPLISAWAGEIIMTMFIKVLPGYKIKQKHLCVVLVMLVCKVQPLVGQIEFAINGESWHEYPITKGIFNNTIIQAIILIQLLFLSTWSQICYKNPKINDSLGEVENDDKFYQNFSSV